MPYNVITTTPPNLADVPPHLRGMGQEALSVAFGSATRRRVPTLNEALSQIRTDLCDFHGSTGPDDAFVVATLDLTESGGTIGPLPDGTMIIVEPVE